MEGTGKRPTEKWLGVVGYPKYLVSDQGRIMNAKRGNVLSPITLSKGYPGVRLYNEYGGITLKVHRVVAVAWLPNPEELPQVNHKSGDKWDSSVDNLEWCSNLHNMQHAIATGLQVHVRPHADSYAAVVLLKRAGMSDRAVGKLLGISKSNVNVIFKSHM